jgi:hypothetical protein
MPEIPYSISKNVDNFIKNHPYYPAAILDLLKSECQLNAGYIVADIGSGIDILSE